ncbi:glycosyl hydrolase family 18 protein [Facilibium subflavum]|uniref:glycosyl hydrolase family 18 protein n=1 Tax=Facilibium subflavum TaxID=2219058 RepID=UPI000E655B78|nr:glycosyl hydrolase family 18 protein [Facilibium subflavum]
MNRKLIYSSLLFVSSANVFAVSAPAPLDCMSFKTHADYNGRITMTNNCNQPIDLRDGLIQFNSSQQVRRNYFWGEFGKLAYPQNRTLASTPSDDGYIISAGLQFAQSTQWYKPKTKLEAGDSITIKFSSLPTAQYSHVNFTPNSPIPPVKKDGEIDLALPDNPGTQKLANIEIIGSTGYDQTIDSASWNTVFPVKNLPYGDYQIKVKNIIDGNKTYTGKALPESLTINNNQAKTVNINYNPVQETGGIQLRVIAQKPEDNINNPTFEITNLKTGNTIQKEIPWNSSQIISGLTAADSYQLSSEAVVGKSHLYKAQFLDENPVVIKANANITESVSFKSSPVTTSAVNSNVTGLVKGQKATITFKDNLNYTYQAPLKEGESQVALLPSNRTYAVSASSFLLNDKTYTPTITPNQFNVMPNKPVSLDIKYKANETGNFVTYWGGWNNIPLDKLDKTKVNVVDLAFGDIKKDQQGHFKVDTSVSGYLTDVPVNNGKQIRPEYLSWTNYAYNHPGVKFMLSIGGATFSHIWDKLLTSKTVDSIAQAIVDKLKLNYPVYNGKFANKDSIIGYAHLVGVDLDAESNNRMSAQQADNLAALIKAIKQKLPDTLITVAGFSTGAGDNVDGRTCAVQGSRHCGELVPVMQKAKDDISWINIMAYNGGPDYACAKQS